MVSRLVNLDMDVLRTFHTGISLGSFAKAAERLGRSPSAISLQLRKLEEQAGQTLVAKKGRGLVLTEAGEIMLSYAGRLLELNDEATALLSGMADLEGWVRIGMPQDFAETSLPALLGRFSRLYPKVRVEAHVERGKTVMEAVARGELDLALSWGAAEGRLATALGRHPVSWIAADGWQHRPGDPLALVAFDAPCTFRARAIEALDRAGIGWQHAFSSPGLSGLWAAVTAGLGVTVRTPHGIPAHLRALDARSCGLPPLGTVDLVLHQGAETPAPAVARFRDILLDSLPAGDAAASAPLP